MADIAELTVNYEEDGVLVVEELDKKVLSKGAWTTIIFKLHQWVRSKNEYGPTRYTIRRYQKVGDVYRQKAKFNISSDDQARKIIQALEEWMGEAGQDQAGEVPSGEEQTGQEQ